MTKLAWTYFRNTFANFVFENGEEQTFFHLP